MVSLHDTRKEGDIGAIHGNFKVRKNAKIHPNPLILGSNAKVSIFPNLVF